MNSSKIKWHSKDNYELHSQKWYKLCYSIISQRIEQLHITNKFKRNSIIVIFLKVNREIQSKIQVETCPL